MMFRRLKRLPTSTAAVASQKGRSPTVTPRSAKSRKSISRCCWSDPLAPDAAKLTLLATGAAPALFHCVHQLTLTCLSGDRRVGGAKHWA
jgi:hypothetical protein